MEDRNRMRNQGRQGQSGKPNPGGGQQGNGRKGEPQSGAENGGGNDRGRRSEGGDKETARPSQNDVTNEGRRPEGQARNQKEDGRQADGGYKYKGGRQGQGGIPNPDDEDDGESAGSFRGTEDLESDADDYDDSGGEQDVGVEQNPASELNSPIREPEEDRDPRRVEPSEDETRNPS